MKSMILHFEEERYAKIPSPKSTWVRNLVLEELQNLDRKSLEPEGDQDFCFLIGGKFVQGRGRNKVEVLRAMGYEDVKIYAGLAEKHGTVQQAKDGGWYEEIKLNEL